MKWWRSYRAWRLSWIVWLTLDYSLSDFGPTNYYEYKPPTTLTFSGSLWLYPTLEPIHISMVSLDPYSRFYGSLSLRQSILRSGIFASLTLCGFCYTHFSITTFVSLAVFNVLTPRLCYSSCASFIQNLVALRYFVAALTSNTLLQCLAINVAWRMWRPVRAGWLGLARSWTWVDGWSSWRTLASRT